MGLFNHISWVDSITLLWLFAPSGAAPSWWLEVACLPVHAASDCSGCTCQLYPRPRQVQCQQSRDQVVGSFNLEPCAGVSIEYNAHLPLIGTCIRAFQNIYVSREAVYGAKHQPSVMGNRNLTVSKAIAERCAHWRAACCK